MSSPVILTCPECGSTKLKKTGPSTYTCQACNASFTTQPGGSRQPALATQGVADYSTISNVTEPLAAVDKTKARKLRWGSLAAWIGLISLLVVVGIALYISQKGRVGQGEKAPAFTLTTFDNQQISLESLKGKVVVVNFWASWCIPCEQEAADLQAAWEYYQPGGNVVFLGIDYVDTNPEAMAYLKKFNITYLNGPDLGTRISEDFRMTGVPETYVIDQDGMLVGVKVGPFTTLQEIQSMIDPHLNP